MQTGQFVVVRTFSAGVHVGTLTAADGKNVTLVNARRVWRWRGANTLHELALRGCDEIHSRISEPVAEIALTEVIEIIAASDAGRENLSRSRWGK